MFERPEWLWVLIAVPLVVEPAYRAVRDGHRLPGLVSGMLRAGSFTVIIFALAGARIPWRGYADRVELIVALDQSGSIAPDQHQWMLQRLGQIRRAMSRRDLIGVLGFGRDAHMMAAPVPPRTLRMRPIQTDPGATDIAGAIEAASGVFENDETLDKRVLLLSDGNETKGDAETAARELAVQELQVFTDNPPPPAQARIAVSNFDGPATVRAETGFDFRLDVDSEAQDQQPAVIKLYADDKAVGASKTILHPGLNHLRLPYQVGQPGAYLMKAEVTAAPPLVAVNRAVERPLAVVKPPKVLIISGGALDSLSGLLRLRGFDIATTAPRSLPTDPEDYLAYQAVIVTNTPAEALSEQVQWALNRYVSDYGGGLVVVGESLRDAGFHEGPLEKVLPVEFMPQPPPPSREPIAVYLLIDRSNSMSYDSREPAVRDGERIRYAKQAAAALLNQLDDTDYAGVIAFDSEPYVLGHLQPLARDRGQLLGEVQRLEPGGGTDFKEALEIAKHEILASGIVVRQVILLTDGDTNRQYHDHDELMHQFASEDVPVSTIRIGPDLENLRLLQDFAAATGGSFYRVGDITKLPQLLVHLTHEAQNFKLRSHTRVEVTGASSILNGIDPRSIPPVDYFAATKSKDGATTALTAHRGAVSAPLLAVWQYALGRTAIVAADPESIGSIAWLRWDHYAEFWSQLINWAAREGASGFFNLEVRNEPDGGMKIEAQAAGPITLDHLFARISNGTRATDVALTQVGRSLYLGDTTIPLRGKYKLALVVKSEDAEQLLLERDFASTGQRAADSAEMELRPANVALLTEIARSTGGRYHPGLPDLLQRSGGKVRIWMPITGLAPPAAIMMILGDVLVRRRFIGE